MTTQQVKDYLRHLALASGFKASGIDPFLDSCIQIGLNEFWNAKGWSFRASAYTLSITAEQEDYELPGQFAGFRSARQQDSLEGGELTYLRKNDFDVRFPRPTHASSGYPQVFTAWRDRPNGPYKVKFFPVPQTGYSILFEMYTIAPNGAQDVPAGFEGGLMRCIEKYMYKVGTPERAMAIRDATDEINRLEVVDGPFKGAMTQMYDDTYQQVETERLWI